MPSPRLAATWRRKSDSLRNRRKRFLTSQTMLKFLVAVTPANTEGTGVRAISMKSMTKTRHGNGAVGKGRDMFGLRFRFSIRGVSRRQCDPQLRMSDNG